MQEVGSTDLILAKLRQVRKDLDGVSVESHDDEFSQASVEYLRTFAASLPQLPDATRLLQEIEERLSRNRQVATYRLGHDRGSDIAWLYQHGEVLERHDDEEGANLTVRLSPDDRNRFEQGRGRSGALH